MFKKNIFDLRKLLTFLQGSPMLLSSVQQETILSGFREPVDDVERSYFQYKTQCILCKDRLFIFKNIFAFIFLTFIFLRNMFSNTLVVKDKNSANVFFFAGTSSVLPSHLKNDCIKSPLHLSTYLSKNDMKFLLKIFLRYPFSQMFLLKNAIKISNYSHVIDKYNPERIISSSEYSYTSSILTLYCENRGIEHINVMHGEKIFNIREAFCRFTKFYVWDKYYIQLFKSLKADKSAFIVEQCEATQLDVAKYVLEQNDYYDYTFYLAVEDIQTLSKLREVANILQRNNKRVIMRPHPLYTDIDLLNSFFVSEEIEKNNEVELPYSVARARNVVSVGSTVLYQAYLVNKNIIIDDVTNINRYEWFESNDYIMFSKPHRLLSSILP